MIDQDEFLSKYRENITIVPCSVQNTVSSSLVRRLISENKSAAFLVPHQVLEYIEEHGLYGCVKESQGLKH
jgi:nicotinamide mononucleotide adenylyltransferase